MNTRLAEIIKYKTGGKQAAFAEIMDWSPQYLTRLLKGENFGLSPVLTILEKLPEIDARWLLTGEGSMLLDCKIAEVRTTAQSYIQTILDAEKFLPVMSSDELHKFEQSITKGERIYFSPEDVSRWESLLEKRNNEMNGRVAKAKAKSDELCRRKADK